MKKIKLSEETNWIPFLNFFSILNLFSSLTIEEEQLLIWHYFNGISHKECAKLRGNKQDYYYGITTRQNISFIISKALRKMKLEVKSMKLKNSKLLLEKIKLLEHREKRFGPFAKSSKKNIASN